MSYREGPESQKMQTWWQGARYGWGRVAGSSIAFAIGFMGWVVAVLVILAALATLDHMRASTEKKAICHCSGGVYHAGKCFSAELIP